MAKKREKDEETAGQRQTRKDVLREQKQAEQVRNVRIIAVIVGVLLAAVVLFALVNEYIVNPGREVATVGSAEITLKEWQDRVKFERAQRIITLEDQLEMFNNDVGLVQQFSGQAINELQSTEELGEATLNRMAQDKIIVQALEERGIVISDEEIDQRIEEAFNYYGGDSPTAVPLPAETAVPTPSVTPIASGEESEIIEEAQPLEPIPTSEPLPTPTPVSDEAFQQEFGDLMDQYGDLGVGKDVYRSLVAGAMAGERLLDILAEEEELSDEDVHTSAFILDFPSEKEANDAVDDIETTDFLTVWNTIKSRPEEEFEDAAPATASEILWQSRESISRSFDPAEAEAIFDTPINEPSAIIELSGADGSPRYIIVMPSGREVRPLSDNEMQGRKIQLLTSYINEATNNDVEIGEFWRNRVPTLPILNPKFLQPPTPTPALPVEPESNSTE